MQIDPITGGMTLADDALKAGIQIQGERNAPAEVAAKQSAQVQARKDAILALITLAEKGDLSALSRRERS